VPPAKCPECGRFLAKAFVADLTSSPQPCPKCETTLTAELFTDEIAAPPPAAPAVSAPPAVPAAVRPPDLDPGDVRVGEDGRRDPLDGWDTDTAAVYELDRFRAGRQPPPDAAILAGTGLAGALLGAAATRRRGKGALLGLAAGVAAGAVARQVWRLPD
jgi:hypothetical protein